MENTLTVSPILFTAMISGLIASGVKFDSKENDKGLIVVTFTGGY